VWVHATNPTFRSLWIALWVTRVLLYTDILWRVFHILTEPVHVGPRFIIPSIYGYKRINGTGSVKIRKTRHKISVNIRILFTVYGGDVRRRRGGRCCDAVAAVDWNSRCRRRCWRRSRRAVSISAKKAVSHLPPSDQPDVADDRLHSAVGRRRQRHPQHSDDRLLA